MSDMAGKDRKADMIATTLGNGAGQMQISVRCRCGARYTWPEECAGRAMFCDECARVVSAPPKRVFWAVSVAREQKQEDDLFKEIWSQVSVTSHPYQLPR